jgi:putative salt-induced outer membrane protein
MKIFHTVILAGTLLASGSALAEDKKEEKKSPWTSSAELGFIRTTGNTETQTSALKVDVVYEVDKWRHTGHFEGYGSESEDDDGVNIVSAERYELSGKSDYKFNEFDYMFGLVKLQKDRFSVEIGPGIRFFKVDDRASDEEAILRLAANYWWKITPTSKFTQELSTEIGEDITSSQSITGIQANINSTLALKFTYTFKHKTKVPEDNEKVDTELAMTLVYNF